MAMLEITPGKFVVVDIALSALRHSVEMDPCDHVYHYGVFGLWPDLYFVATLLMHIT